MQHRPTGAAPVALPGVVAGSGGRSDCGTRAGEGDAQADCGRGDLRRRSRRGRDRRRRAFPADAPRGSARSGGRDRRAGGRAPADRSAAGAPAEEQVFRVLTAGSGARYATKVRAGRPEIPKVEVSGEEARQLPGSSGDPLRVLGSLAGRRADRLAGGALRGARRQPGQHRLLPGRHSRARAVSPGARAVGHSSLSDRRRRLLSGRSAGQLRTLRLGDHGRPHRRAAGRSRPCRRRRDGLRRRRDHDRALGRRARHRARRRALLLHRRAVLGAPERYHPPLRGLSAARRPSVRGRAGDAVRLRGARRRRLDQPRLHRRSTGRCSSTASICAGGARSGADGCWSA